MALAKLPPLPRKKRGWGNVGVGNWAPNLKKTRYLLPNQKGSQVVGTCALCGATKAAFELELRRKPFGSDDFWACKGGCA